MYHFRTLPQHGMHNVSADDVIMSGFMSTCIPGALLFEVPIYHNLGCV